VCADTDKIKDAVTDLIANNSQELNKIKRFQRIYTNPDAAEDIVNFILSIKSNFDEVTEKDADFLISKINM
jgi:processive 1,2-diacylglycerol beta-glucosyltransferase